MEDKGNVIQHEVVDGRCESTATPLKGHRICRGDSTISGLRAIASSVVRNNHHGLVDHHHFPAGKEAKVRRLDPADQICALLAIKDDCLRYLREGPGSIYFTRQRDDRRELIVKWGETSCLSRRQLEYEECGGAGQTQMWFVVFEVQQRLLAERIIRLGLIGQGYGRVRFKEPCLCGTSHCEYHWMRPGGSLEEIETIARECLAIIEEPTVIRKNLRPRRRYYFKCLSGSIRWNNNMFCDMKHRDSPGDDAPTIQREHPGSAKAHRVPISRTEAIAMARRIAKRGNCGCAGGGRE
ncbi:hypothetical protein B0H14DRAFT_2636833 [Mycena olivaceomarginata]|nr:hypothetical protein B0H14DRAFT_2636833 [Mycena olivaceomarginata]